MIVRNVRCSNCNTSNYIIVRAVTVTDEWQIRKETTKTYLVHNPGKVRT